MSGEQVHFFRHVGQKKAREIWFLCEQYSAHEAEKMGMVNKVVTHNDLEVEALEWAAEINSKSPTAIRMLKFAFNLVDDGLVGQQLFAGEATRLAYSTDEASEGSSSALYRDLVPVDITYMGANGLQGMSGNVWEWVNDWYAPYIADEQINPTGPKNGFWKVLRGGSYQNLNHPQKSGFPILLSPRFRNHAHPDDQKAHLGFRCVWDKMD